MHKLTTYEQTKGPVLIIDRDELGRHLQSRHTILLDTLRNASLPISGIELDEALAKIDRFILLFDNSDLMDKYQFYNKYRQCLQHVEDFGTVENFVYHQLMRLSRASDRALMLNSELRAVLVEELKYHDFSDELLNKLMVTSGVISFDFVDDEHYWSITDFSVDVNKKATFNVNKTAKPFHNSVSSDEFQTWLYAENQSIRLLTSISKNDRILKAISHWFLLHEEINEIKNATGKYFEMFMFDINGRMDFSKTSGAVNMYLRQTGKSATKPCKYIEFATYETYGGKKTKFEKHIVPYLDFWSSLNVKFNNTYNLAFLDEFKHDINLYARYKRADLSKAKVENSEEIVNLLNSVIGCISTMTRQDVLQVIKLAETKLSDEDDLSVKQRRQLNIDSMITDLADKNPKQSNESLTIHGELEDPDKPKEFVMPHSIYQDEYLPLSRAGEYSAEAAEKFGEEISREWHFRMHKAISIKNNMEQYKDNPVLLQTCIDEWKYFMSDNEYYDATRAKEILVPFGSLEWEFLKLQDSKRFQALPEEEKQAKYDKLIQDFLNKEKIEKEKAAMLNGDHLVKERKVHEFYTQELHEKDKSRKITENEELQRRVEYMLKQKRESLQELEQNERNDNLNKNLIDEVEASPVFVNPVTEVLAMAPEVKLEKTSFEDALNNGPMGKVTSTKPEPIPNNMQMLWPDMDKQVTVPDVIELSAEATEIDERTLVAKFETPLISYPLSPVKKSQNNGRAIKKELCEELLNRPENFYKGRPLTPYDYVTTIKEYAIEINASGDMDRYSYITERLAMIFPNDASMLPNLYWHSTDYNQLMKALNNEYERVKMGDIIDFRTLSKEQQIVMFSNEFYEIRLMNKGIFTFFKDHKGKLTSYGAQGTPFFEKVRSEYQKFLKIVDKNFQVLHWQMVGEYPVPVKVANDSMCYTLQTFEQWCSDNLLDITDDNKVQLQEDYHKAMVRTVGEHFRRLSPDLYKRINAIQRDNTYQLLLHKYIINSEMYQKIATQYVRSFNEQGIKFDTNDALRVATLSYLLKNGYGVSVYERLLWARELVDYMEMLLSHGMRIKTDYLLVNDWRKLEELIYCKGFEVISSEVLYNDNGNTPWKYNAKQIGNQHFDNISDESKKLLQNAEEKLEWVDVNHNHNHSGIHEFIDKSMFRRDIDNSKFDKEDIDFWIETFKLPGTTIEYFENDQCEWNLPSGVK